MQTGTLEFVVHLKNFFFYFNHINYPREDDYRELRLPIRLSIDKAYKFETFVASTEPSNKWLSFHVFSGVCCSCCRRCCR